ncbi:hypothetical protein BCF74_11089 [Knoellia remsis]|uniref:Glyoxalase-like domain-containing protein n=1 Tax=Knoellia remsis TaxID=407159 RepID=A0A2T0UN52_9MICO|nr:VOC family protein [Knoellia remsis]PRY59352.1 hypothetical protein BCF74_11089 [Knoellia remsis]
MIQLRWVWVFLDTPEADAPASEAFWRRVTRTHLSSRRGGRAEFATLLPEQGDPWLKVQRITDSPIGGKVHLDRDVDDVDTAAAEATRLGAMEVRRDPDGTVVVMRSPGGFVFCITSWADHDSATTQVRGGQPDLLDQVCLDAPSEAYAVELAFWERLTGWSRGEDNYAEFTSLERPDGIPVKLLVQRLGEPTGTVRGHLDFATHDREASVETHVAAGAKVVSVHDGWHVMRDPVGRTYCLTRRTP